MSHKEGDPFVPWAFACEEHGLALCLCFVLVLVGPAQWSGQKRVAGRAVTPKAGGGGRSALPARAATVNGIAVAVATFWS